MISVAATFWLATLLTPCTAGEPHRNFERPRAEVPFNAIIESIEFEEISIIQRDLIVSRLGVHSGDKLTLDLRKHIERELAKIQKNLTCTYWNALGFRRAKLIISAGC